MNSTLENEMRRIAGAKRIVVKVGTSTITYENGRLNLRRVESLIKVLSDVKNAGREIVFVTSGAIGVGLGRLGLRERPTDIGTKQAAAAVGQCELMHVYDKHFSEYDHVTAQVLLTRDVVESEVKKTNVVNTLSRLLALGAIPVVNENDTVAVDEIESGGRFGDNDTLSAVVAGLAGAQVLILLTDIDGLYSADPRIDPAAHKVAFVETIDDELIASAGGAGSARGTGGMATKVQAAAIATRAGITTVIMDSNSPQNLYRLLEGEALGTVFAAGHTD